MSEPDYNSLEEAIERIKSLEDSNAALEQKYADCPHPKGWEYWPCGCSFDHPSDVCAVHAPQLKQALEQLAEKERALALLMDPHAVHINILRGTLPLTKEQAIHIAGLPADIEKQLAEALRIAGEYRKFDEFIEACAITGGKDHRCVRCKAYDAMVAQPAQREAAK